MAIRWTPYGSAACGVYAGVNQSLTSPPGGGKTSFWAWLAKHMGWRFTEISVKASDPVDIQGIRGYGDKDEFGQRWLEFYKPDYLMPVYEAEREGVGSILHYDEWIGATKAQTNAAEKILSDRMVGPHKLPDNCVIVLSSNPADQGGTGSMGPATANRLVHCAWHVDHLMLSEGMQTGWQLELPKYDPALIKREIDIAYARVAAWIAFRGHDILKFPKDKKQQCEAWASNRTVERYFPRVEGAFRAVEPDINAPGLTKEQKDQVVQQHDEWDVARTNMLGGTVGHGNALDYETYVQKADLMTYEDVLKGFEKGDLDVPQRGDHAVAVLGMVLAAVGEKPKDRWVPGLDLLANIYQRGTQADIVYSHAKKMLSPKLKPTGVKMPASIQVFVDLVALERGSI